MSVRFFVVLGCFASACGPKPNPPAFVYPEIEGLSIVKSDTNAELVGKVSGKATAAYKGCEGLPEQAYEKMVTYAKEKDVDAVGNFWWALGTGRINRPAVSPVFFFFYWGCTSKVTANAYRLTE
jgi:hypothetical protein